MNTPRSDVSVDAKSGLAVGKSTALKVAVLYIGLVGLWILIQSGIPMSFFIDHKIERFTWTQTVVGWFFIVSTGWLLYLLMARGLELIAAGQEELKLRDRAIESSTNAIFITDSRRPDYPIVYVNPAFERITGYSSAEAIGRNPRFLQAGDLDQPGLEALRIALREHRECRAVIRNYRKDGTLYWNDLHIAPVRDDQGAVTHYVGVQDDVTETRKYQEQLARQANYDALTGLPNRNLLTDRAEKAMSRAARYGGGVTVVFIDLDNFRNINDSLGHAVGDQMVRSVGERISSCLRAVDTVARLGGDEFVLLLGEQKNEKLVSGQIRRILDVFSRPFVVEGRELFVSASVGVAFYPMDGTSFEKLLQNAEVAMYRAKDVGHNSFRFYTTDMNAQVSERLAMESWLRRALERKELLLHYQPQIDLASGRIFGAEALVRWQHPTLGLVSPVDFVPLAEQTGLIVSIGEWVLRAACGQAKAWQDAGLPPVSVAVNVSARQFREKGLVDTIAAILGETGLEPRFLEIEVTESVIMHDAEEVVTVLKQFRSMGIRISIDDFGTGYSSLSYLKRFPVDRLKIDQSFVRNIARDPDDAAIAQAIITLGHSLGLRVIAEGVETREQLDFLRSRQCDENQGYLFSRPLPAENFAKLLRDGCSLAQ